MIAPSDLQGLLDFRGEGASVLSVYLDTNLTRQAKDQCKLTLREKLRQVTDKELSADMQRVERFFDYEYDWQRRGAVVFSCQKRGFWQAFSLAVPVSSLVFVAETPYVKPLTDLLDEYERYGVILVDQENARLLSIQLGEIQEESEIYGEVVKRHKQGGRSQAAYQRRTDMQVLHNLKAAAEAAAEFCQQRECKGLILAGSDETLVQFHDLLPKKMQKQVVGTIAADMATSSAEILERAMEVFLAAKHKEENALVRQMLTATAKGEAGAMGLADTLYATHQGRVHILLVEQGYEAPGAFCDHCGYVGAAQGQKCLFCGSKMRSIDNAVDLAVHKVLDAGGKVRVLDGNEELAKAGHIGAILRY